MKKILFATTALVATAGMAAADITLSGYGRFGIQYNDNDPEEFRVDQRLRLIITGTAESDNGISFTAQTRLQWDDGASTVGDTVKGAAGPGARDAAFHASYGGFTLSLGNVSGSEAQPGFYAGSLGYTGFMYVDPHSIGYGNHDIGLVTPGTDGVVMATYAAGDFNVRASFSNDGINDRIFVGMDYTFGDYLIALSHQESDLAAEDVTKLYFQGKMGNTTFGLFVDDTTFGNSFGVTATTAIGAATTATFTAASVEGALGNYENYGVGVNHDLGGGVSVAGGIADFEGDTVAEAGVVFNF